MWYLKHLHFVFQENYKFRRFLAGDNILGVNFSNFLESNENSLGLIHFAAVGLVLISASGLDKEPEIAAFNLR